MTEEELLKFINITDDLVIIDKEFFEKVLNPCMEIAVNKHKQLISFLEDKIKENKLNLLNLKNNIGTTYEEIGKYKGGLQAYLETLDFVKGDENDI